METEAAKVVTFGERVWPKIGATPSALPFFGHGRPTKEEAISIRQIAGRG
jgi:hypothetical protein